MASHKQWHVAYTQDLDIPIKVTFTETMSRFNGSYSDVYIGRFRDRIVSLHDAPLNRHDTDGCF